MKDLFYKKYDELEINFDKWLIDKYKITESEIGLKRHSGANPPLTPQEIEAFISLESIWSDKDEYINWLMKYFNFKEK